MKLDDLLAELGNRMGLGALHLDDRNLCRLVFDDKLVVDMEQSPDDKAVHLYAVVAPIPADADVAYYRVLLDANLGAQDTGGGALCIDSETNEVLLGRVLPLEATDVQLFEDSLEAFLNAVEGWSERLEQSPTESEQSPATGTENLDPGAIRV